jgi:glutathione S-transferase
VSVPIEVYYWPTPNGHKVTIALEEMGLPYEIKPVNIGRWRTEVLQDCQPRDERLWPAA